MKGIRYIVIAALTLALMGITACEKEAESVEVAVSEPAPTVTTETIKETPVEEEPEEFQINPVEVEAPFENEKAEAAAQEIFQLEVEAYEDYLVECEHQPYIYDRQIITKKNGEKLYSFCTSISPDGQDDSIYVIGENLERMEIVWNGCINPRYRFYIYEGAYLQYVGSSSEFDEEDLCFIANKKKKIYSYSHGYFGDYLLDPEMNSNYEKEIELYNSLIEDLKKAGLTEKEIDGIEFQRMDIGKKTVIQVALRTSDELKKTIYDVFEKSEISKTVTLVSDDIEFIVKCRNELKEQGVDIEEVFKGKILTGYGTEKESLIWNPNKESVIESGNAEFDKCINEVVEFLPTEELEYTEWVKEGECFRVALQLINDPDDRYQHNRDYIFVKKDGKIKWIMVDYPGMYDWKKERYVHSACDFLVAYEDVSFDRNKDIVISLGHAGPRGIEISCAYIYKDGEFVYTESFENIPYYSINEKEKRIYGWYYDGMLANDVICKYKFKNGEFVLESEEEYSDKKYGDFCFYSSMDKWEVRKTIRNKEIEYNGEIIKLSDFLTSDRIFYSEGDVAGNSRREEAFIQDGTLYLIDWNKAEGWDRGKVIYEGTAYEHLVEWGEKIGILYKRDGGGPTHIDYQFIGFNVNDVSQVECTWSCYDTDENGIYDQNDLYYVDDREMKYEEWKAATEGFSDSENRVRAWIEIILNP